MVWLLSLITAIQISFCKQQEKKYIILTGNMVGAGEKAMILLFPILHGMWGKVGLLLRGWGETLRN